jgi:AP-3 complex subunit delta-1
VANIASKFLYTVCVDSKKKIVTYTLLLSTSYLEDIPSTLECLLSPQVIHLPAKVQTIYVHSVIKIYAFWTNELASQWNPELEHEFTKVTKVMYDKMNMFTQSKDLEVQERAYDVKSLFNIILDAVHLNDSNALPSVLQGLPELFFIYELNPVAPKAQSKVPVPEGLDLDAWINDPLPDLIDDVESDEICMAEYDNGRKSATKKKSTKKSRKSKATAYSSEDEMEKEQVKKNHQQT